MEIMLKLITYYKRGGSLEHNVYYVHTENNCLYFTVVENPSPVFQEPVKIPLENIEKFEVIPTELTYR